jgi:membrane protein DedA with SNARE-associated domain
VTINDQLLAALALYGLPVLFGVALMASLWVPVPATFLLIAAGSFVQQGDMNLWWVIALATAGAVLGDQIGYGIGRWGSQRLARHLSRWANIERRLQSVEATAKKWGGPGIFFSRWLIIPLGPWLNLVCGISQYSYPHFLFWDVSGELIWSVVFVAVGALFSDRVQALTQLLGNSVWAAVGLIAAILFGWQLARYFRNTRHEKAGSARAG